VSDADFQTVLWETKRALAVATEHAFARHGVRAGQQFVLTRLWQHDGQSPGGIASQLGLATPTLTRTASRLEAAGLLTRKSSITDNRKIELWLTDRGRALEPMIGRELAALTERALGGLTQRQRVQLVSHLRIVLGSLAGPGDEL